MPYAIITSFAVGLLYLVSLTATIQVIVVNPKCRDSTYHHVLCILHLTLRQGVCFWLQMNSLACASDGMYIRPKVYSMQSNPLSLLFVNLRFVHNHVMCA